MEKKVKKKKEKLRGVKSLRISIAVLCDLSIIIVMAVSMMVTIPNYESNMKVQVKNNMDNLCIAYGKLVDNELGRENSMSQSDAKSLLEDVKVQGLDSSYTYLVSKDGTMIYHPTDSKIGQPVENSVVLSVVDKLKSGEVPDNEVVEYDFKGVKKYAGYYVSPKNHLILVVTADEEEVLKPVSSLLLKIIIIEFVILIVVSAIVEIVTIRFVKPIKKLTDLVNKTAKYDFSDNVNCDDISIRRDEIGQIARAFLLMRDNIKDIIRQIDNVSNSISNSSDNLRNITNVVNDNSSNNSATTEELAASMEEASIDTGNINKNIIAIEGKVKDINSLTQKCLQTSKEVFARAENINMRTENAKINTKKLCAEVMKKTEIAITQAKSVDKINELANAIMSVTNQTSMLALNASIEAARAGESGKGFAVVADQISTLANKSAETVNGITAIIEDVNIAVGNMINCMNQTLEFLNKDITNDYEGFTKVGNQYRDDANTFENNSINISDSMNVLSSEMEDISKSISSMNETINCSTVGIKDIAQKTCDIVNSIANIYDTVEQNVKYSNDLSCIVSKFSV